jgi:hypothetical protein
LQCSDGGGLLCTADKGTVHHKRRCYSCGTAAA